MYRFRYSLILIGLLFLVSCTTSEPIQPRIILEEGMAHQYLYDKKYFYYDLFVEAENKAKEEKKGLWGKC